LDLNRLLSFMNSIAFFIIVSSSTVLYPSNFSIFIYIIEIYLLFILC